MTAPLTVVEDEAAAGELVADRVVAIAAGHDRPVVLGLPSGRTPRSTYAALGRRVAAGELDPTRLRLVMMDEYVEDDGAGGWRAVDREALHSCRRFADHEVVPVLGVDPTHVHFPDPADPDAYERTIADLGGIDLFVLASGASDGHVAFNPPGSPALGGTRVVELAEATRIDNLGTFPSFAGLHEVPTHGVSVGLGTIAAARSAVLLLLGAHKHEALARSRDGYDPSWPASIVHTVADAAIVADRAALEG